MRAPVTIALLMGSLVLCASACEEAASRAGAGAYADVVAADAAPEDGPPQDAAPENAPPADAAPPTFPHRAVAVACTPPAAPEEVVPCTEPAWPGYECGSAADCPAERPYCLNSHEFAADTACHCHAYDCLTDADCPAGQLCACGGAPQAGQAREACGGWRSRCTHTCVPAGCRTDADCGPGAWCVPSPSHCGPEWGTWGWFCLDPRTAGCLTAADCEEGQEVCLYETEPDQPEGWRCAPLYMCD